MFIAAGLLHLTPLFTVSMMMIKRESNHWLESSSVQSTVKMNPLKAGIYHCEITEIMLLTKLDIIENDKGTIMMSL